MTAAVLLIWRKYEARSWGKTECVSRRISERQFATYVDSVIFVKIALIEVNVDGKSGTRTMNCPFTSRSDFQCNYGINELSVHLA